MTLRVDVATGATVLHEEDLRLPGVLPLVLSRTYRSDATGPGPLGPGWRFSVDASLEVGRDRLVVRGVGEREVVFTPIAPGVQATHHETGLVLQHHPQAYVAYFSPLARLVFPKQNAVGSRLCAGQLEDASGNSVRLLYHGGLLAGLVDSAGRQVRFTHRGDRIESINLMEDGKHVPVRAFRYDAAGDLVAARDASGREWRYSYQDHLLVSCTNRLGGTYYAQYDGGRRCIARWRSDGAEARRLDYDDVQKMTRVVGDGGLQTIYQQNGPLTTIRVDSAGRAMGYAYDEHHRFMSVTDEDEGVVTFQRLDGEARTLTRCAGDTTHPTSVWQAELDSHGLAQRIRVGTFGPFDLAYDARGHLATLSTPAGARWRFERDSRGGVRRVVAPSGRWASVSWADGGRELTVADALGTRFRERYDAAGRIAERRDALGRTLRWQYDPGGRLAAVASGGGYVVRFAYDAAGFLVGIIGAASDRVVLRRDLFGRAQEPPAAASNEDAHSGGDGTAERERSGNRATAVRGLAGEPLRLGPESDPTTLLYDPAGHLTTAVHGGRRLLLHRDEDGLIESLQVEEAEPLPIRRDTRGRVIEIGLEARGCRFDYDAADRLTRVTTVEGESFPLEYDSFTTPTPAGVRPDDRERIVRRTLREGEPAVTLVAGGGGVLLVASFGHAEVLLWGQRPWPFAPPATAEVLLRGAGAVLSDAAVPDPEGHLAAWECRGGFRSQPSDVPTPHELGLPLPLDGWIARRVVYDSAVPALQLLHVPAPEADARRALDDAVTGSHRVGRLKPSAPFPSPQPRAASA